METRKDLTGRLAGKEPDPVLSMTNVLTLDLNADVAYFTACRTGYGRCLSGESIMSLGRVFRCSGARTTPMSLWSVYEDSSVVLMQNFFQYLKDGKQKLEARHLAKKDLWKPGFERGVSSILQEKETSS